MSFVNTIVTNAVANTIAKNKQPISKIEISRRKIAFIQVALEFGEDTKKAITVALRNKQLPGTPANIESVQKIYAAIDNVRRNRVYFRARAHGYEMERRPVPTGRAPVTLPNGRLADRLNEIRRKVVKHWAFSVIRHGAPGGTTMTVNFASNTSEVDYQISVGRSYDVYRGAFKGWGANVDSHKLVIPNDWRVRVQRQGLADLGGMLTLDALRLESPKDMKLFAAVWVVQSRGYSVKVERGYIAIAGSEHYHAESVEGAIRGLKSKCKATLALADLDLSTNAFADKYANILIDVSLDDARKSGSCEYGIRSWCSSVGIDVERLQVPMPELLDAFRRLPFPEVRRAVLKAIKRNRVKVVA